MNRLGSQSRAKSQIEREWERGGTKLQQSEFILFATNPGMIVRNVPALKCTDELVTLFGSYGEISEFRLMEEEDHEPFTEVCWIKFLHVSNARFAKRKLDEHVFYGNPLQVSYAPQYETLADTKEKLEVRRKDVLNRLNNGKNKEPKPQDNQKPMVGPLLPPTHKRNYIQGNLIQGYPNQQISHVHDQVNLIQGQYLQPRASTSRVDLNRSTVSSSGQYFSSMSMNETVQMVREKMDKIQSVDPRNHEHHGYPEAGTSVKKARVDNRRRI